MDLSGGRRDRRGNLMCRRELPGRRAPRPQERDRLEDLSQTCRGSVPTWAVSRRLPVVRCLARGSAGAGDHEAGEADDGGRACLRIMPAGVGRRRLALGKQDISLRGSNCRMQADDGLAWGQFW